MNKKVWHRGHPEEKGEYWVYSQITDEKPHYRLDRWNGIEWVLVDSKYVLYWSEIIPVEGNCDD